MDREKQIEEIAKDIKDSLLLHFDKTILYPYLAQDLNNKGYRKINENEIVISKEEFWKLSNKFSKKELDEIVEFHKSKARKEEKQKLLKEMYEQSKFDAIADLEKEGKVVISKEEYEKITKELVTEQRAKEIAQEFFGIVRKETAREILKYLLKVGNTERLGYLKIYVEDIESLAEKYGVDLGE